ncbi:unnamed protein product, partial [Meganyctiphanes norvegica]
GTWTQLGHCKEPADIPTPTVTFKVDYGASHKGGTLVIANPYGWTYMHDKGIYFKCVDKNCKARLRAGEDLNNTSSFKPNKTPHTCSPNQAAQLNVMIKKEIKQLAVQQPYADAKDIVTEAFDKYIPVDAPLSGVRSKQNLGKIANRARKPLRGKIPGKDDLLTMELKEEMFPADFYRWDIVVERESANGESDVCRHVFFATENQMTCLAMTTEWRLDETFALVASPFKQLFSIHSPISLGGKDKQYALGFVLMSGRRKEDYARVFQEIIKTLQDRILQVKVKSFLLDYEIAAWQGIREAFGNNIQIRGCYFHFSHAVIRKVHFLGLMGAYHVGGSVHLFTKQLTVLPLLDAAAVPDTFNYMVQKMCEIYDYTQEDYYDLEVRKLKTRPPMIKLFQYFEDQWINGKNFKPTDWTCFKKETRTNNNLETWNGKINKSGGNRGMHIFKLGEFLHEHAKKVETIDFREQIWGVYDNYEKSGTKKSYDHIKKVWAEYEKGKVMPYTLVKQLSLKFNPPIPADVQMDIM